MIITILHVGADTEVHGIHILRELTVNMYWSQNSDSDVNVLLPYYTVS